MQNQTISELYTDYKISKYSSNPIDILKSAKYFYEKLYTEETMSKISNKQSPLRGKQFSRESYKIYKFSNKY